MAQTSGFAVGTLAIGGVLVWSGLKGASILTTIQELVQGKKPTGSNIHQIGVPVGSAAAAAGAAGSPVGSAAAAAGAAIGAAGLGLTILNIAASYKGRSYTFGGGHSSFCPPGGMDCSGYVSCVLHRAGVLNGSPLATDGLASWGVSVPLDQRAPGDVIVWNGGPGGGHCGIIIDSKTMWNNPCTACGGVQIQTYNPSHGSRLMASAVIRRAK